MKKSGKFEKKTEAATGKQPKVKNLLLQTYFTSLLCLVLCVSMFFGTSYAWFSSEVNNTVNEIYIGTLDVGLFKQEGDAWLNLSDSTNKLFDGSIRWEPGYTSLETIRVDNEGDLAFKYELSFTDGAVTHGGAATSSDCAKYFDVWVYTHNGNEAAPADISEAKGWKRVGTLDALLDGTLVLDGVMKTPGEDVVKEQTYTIALHMQESAESGVMGNKITLTVKLVAYQLTEPEEGDDSVTTVSDAATLGSALQAGGNVQLNSSITIASVDERVTMNGGVLDGNGSTITYSGGRSGESSVGVVTTSGGTVKNLTINGGDNGRALYITKLTSDLSVSDCTLSGTYAFNLNSAEETGHSLTFTNTTFKSWTSYANVMEKAEFTNCTFENVLKPYGDTKLTGCTFTTAGLDVSELANGEKIELSNCTYNGVKVTSVILVAAEDGAVSMVSSADELAVSDGMLVVNSSNG